MPRIKIVIAILGFIIVSSIISNNVYAVEYLRDEEPAPDSVEALESPIGESFQIIPRRRILFPILRNFLEKLPPFFSDTQLDLNIRSYYFDRTRADGSESVAWALGGSISYESGQLFKLVSVGGEVFTSQKLYGPEDKDGTLLLRPGQEGFTVLGRAYGKFNYENKLEITVYRQYIDSPYVNKQDNRMVPNTFEAYGLRGDFDTIRFGGGYISKIKRQNSDKFVPMSQIGGIKNLDNGMFILGAGYYPIEEFSIGGVNYFVEDVINIFYAESYFVKSMASGVGVKLSLQYTDQRSVGDDLLGSDFNTWVWGGQIATSYLNTIFRAAFSTTSNDRRIISPYGGYPGYISLIVKDFNRAGEKAFLFGLSHASKIDILEGLSFFTNYAFGYNAVDEDDGQSLPNQREFDITVDYKPESLSVRGLWLRFRYANVDITGDKDSVNDLRVILNYNFPVL